MINSLLWTADHFRDDLNTAYEHAEELVDDERAEVAARRSAAVLQAAE